MRKYFISETTGRVRWQILFFILYSLIAITSIWLTGNSLDRSFGRGNTIMTSILSYVLAFGIFAAASGALAMIKKGLDINSIIEKRTVYTIFGFILFIFIWFLGGITTNTHSYFFYQNINEIQQNELQDMSNKLQLLVPVSEAGVDEIKINYKNDIEAEIENLKTEILNYGKPGHGPKTDSILVRIERLLGQEIDDLDPPGTDRTSLNRYAGQLADKIRVITDLKLSEIDAKFGKIKSFFFDIDNYSQTSNNEEIIEIITDLEFAHKNYTFGNYEENNIILEKAYNKYTLMYDFIITQFPEDFIAERTNIQLKPIDDTPLSVQYEKIITSWTQFLKNENNNSRFLWALAFAILTDILAFFFWWKFIPEED